MGITLSPSAAERWYNCPGSAFVCSKLPRLPSTAAADEGTLAHEFAAYAVAQTLIEATGVMPESGLPGRPEEALATEDMLNAAQIYADSIVLKLNEAFSTFDPTSFSYAIEAWIEHVDPSIRGRYDFEAYSETDQALVIVDFKYGGAAVPAAHNKQLLTYAFCAADTGRPIKRVILGIVQPRSEITDFADYGALWYEPTSEELEAEFAKLKAAMCAATNADETTLRAPGEYCRYCPARSMCRAAIGQKLLLAAIAAGESQMAEDATNEQIGVWLDALREIEDARDDLSRIAKARIGNGDTIPGWRLQPRRVKAWAEDVQNAGTAWQQGEWLSENLGGTVEDFLTVSLRSPSQMAKTIPKDELSRYVEETVSNALVKVKTR